MLGEGFGFVEVRGGYGLVGEGDLDVEGYGDDVWDKDEFDLDGLIGKGVLEEEVIKDVLVVRYYGDFSGVDLLCFVVFEGWGFGRKDM